MTAEPYPVHVRAPYTIDQLDRAMITIAGKMQVRRGDGSWSRPHSLYDTAAVAWINRYPEDEHTAVIRAAIADLKATGCMKPDDGVWPADGETEVPA